MESEKTYLDSLKELLEEAQKTYLSLTEETPSVGVLAAKYLANSDLWGIRAEIAWAAKNCDETLFCMEMHEKCLHSFECLSIPEEVEEEIDKALSSKSN